VLLPISKPPESWTEADLRQLCIDRVPEHQRLDYKEELKLEPPRERRELLKDITSLANSNGGVLIYGIREDKHSDLGHIAGSLQPIQDASLLDKANRIIRSSVSPTVECYLHLILASQGGFYIVAHVPQSHSRPHAITLGNRLDWYIRRNQDNFPMTEPEIRDMYSQSVSAQETLIKRYKELYKDVANIGWLLVSMPLVPGLEILNTLTVSPRQLYRSDYPYSFKLRPNVERFESVTRAEPEVIITRLFRGGEFMISEGYWALSSEVIIATAYTYQLWHNSLKYFGELYQQFNYFGEVRIWFETINLNGMKFGLDRGSYKFNREDILVWMDTTIESLGNPSNICNALYRYLSQGCGKDASAKDIEWLQNKVQT
jgi:hypothetical protein